MITTVITTVSTCPNMGVEPKIGVFKTPQNGWFILMEKALLNKWDDLGGKKPYFWVDTHI